MLINLIFIIRRFLKKIINILDIIIDYYAHKRFNKIVENLKVEHGKESVISSKKPNSSTENTYYIWVSSSLYNKFEFMNQDIELTESFYEKYKKTILIININDCLYKPTYN